MKKKNKAPKTVTRLALHCLRCERDWVTVTDKEPSVCPKCHSPYWNKPRIRPKKEAQTT